MWTKKYEYTGFKEPNHPCPVEIFHGEPYREDAGDKMWIENGKSYKVGGRVEMIPHRIFHNGELKHDGHLFGLCNESTLTEMPGVEVFG